MSQVPAIMKIAIMKKKDEIKRSHFWKLLSYVGNHTRVEKTTSVLIKTFSTKAPFMQKKMHLPERDHYICVAFFETVLVFNCKLSLVITLSLLNRQKLPPDFPSKKGG